MVGADLGVFALDHHVLEVAEHFLALVIGEAATYTTQYMECAFLSENCHEHIVEQARPVAGRFGKADHRYIQIMSRLDFETARHIATADNSLRALFFDPLL